MDRYDARKETFEEIEIFDTLALFSSERIQRESVPETVHIPFQEIDKNQTHHVNMRCRSHYLEFSLLPRKYAFLL
ncbi:LPD28 domain-containing protein [Coprococcus comes]|uniref:LPD28 domain-containing protein n=1 Tax=Coprococcus comes TaxID=410072 RepID=UPI00189BB317|nr:LPD28 domain-containing protein [Coprococcus comes]